MYKNDNAKETNIEDACVFTRRLVLIHKTFAPLGGKCRGKAVGVVWHEAVRGHNAEDVASSYFKVMKLAFCLETFLSGPDFCKRAHMYSAYYGKQSECTP